MSGWRRITHDGVSYRWRFGLAMIVVRLGRDVFVRATPEQITGRDPMVFDRGQWKRTSDGMIKPGHVRGLIRRTLKERRCTST